MPSLYHSSRSPFGLRLWRRALALLLGLLLAPVVYVHGQAPNAPTNLDATAVSATQINLTWLDQSSNETSFKIEFATNNVNGPFSLLVTLGANLQNYSHTGLTANTKYYYRLYAVSASSGNSGYSNVDSVTTFTALPEAPGSLIASAVSSSQINLTWTDNSTSETGFKIERKLSAASIFVQIATVGAGAGSGLTLNFADNSGLSAGTAYDYRVRASSLVGDSPYSNTASATTFTLPPAAPTNLNATTASSSQIDLAWIDNAGNETGFKIERKIGAAGSYVEITTVGANVLIYSDMSLSGNTQYFYRVRAYNAGGNSAYSNEDDATTLPGPPLAPSNLAITVMSNAQLNLSWTDNALDETGFQIESATVSGGPYALIATVAANVTAYANTGLAANTTYFYRVRAINASGNSAYTSEANATTLPNPPTAPSSLVANPISSSQNNLTWTDNATNESGFKIERKIGAAGTYAEITTVSADVTAFSDNGLAASTQYFYQIRAFNVGGNSAYSNEDDATTPSNAPPPPNAPSNLAGIALSHSQINLTWADNSSDEDGFKIERKKGLNGTFTEIAQVGPGVTSFSSTGLNANVKYFFRVRAFNAGGNSAYSAEINVMSLLKTPTNLTATTVSSSQINLAWTDQTTSESGFKIERKTGAAGTYAEIFTTGVNVTTHSDNGLTASTPYFYRVRAFNATNVSAYTNEANATTSAGAPTTPAAPSNLTATTVSSSQINLAWTDNASDETGFIVERKTGAAGTFAQITSLGANVTSFADNSGLAASTQYFYRVAAFNASGNSAYTSEANATTSASTLPNAPTNLAATAMNSTQIDIAWTDAASNETGFKIERKTGVVGTYAEITTTAANVTSYSDNTLTTSTQYFYRVRAFNASGNSAYSGEASATTLSGPSGVPSNLTATAISATQIDLSWTDGSTNESGFKIERKTGAAGSFAEISSVGSNVTSFSDNTVAGGLQYFYRVRAFTAGGNSGYSNEANATTSGGAAPAAPNNLIATVVSSTEITLNWTDNATNETGFAAERKTGAAGTYAQVAALGANAVTFADNGLTAGTQYFYRVRAFNVSGNSVYSNEANATTTAGAPGTPSNLTATAISTSQINLAWTDNATDETGFAVERKTGAAGTYAQIAALGINVASYSDNGLTSNTQYFYRVRAFNGAGNSAYSNEANATTSISSNGNLALNKPTTASSTDSASAASRAVDANTLSFWRSGPVNATTPIAWLQVELTPSGTLTVARVVIKWYQNYFATQYDVQVSTDGVNWTNVHTNNAVTTGGDHDISFTATTAKYVRLYCRKNNKSNYRVAELEVYSTGIAKPALSENTGSGIIAPEAIVLAPNYPNPFSANGTFGNPSTTISYSLPADMSVTLKVINVTGQEVATLVDGHQVRGSYRVMFRAKRLPSGLYYAVLQAGNVRQVQRMVLSK